jgi:hypothetical protein
MIGAGMGQGLNRAIKTAGYQMMDPNEKLMDSVLKSYGFKLGAGGAAGAGAAGAAGGATGAAGGGGLMAGLKSL